MTAGGAQFVEFVKEQLVALPKLATARFFGGVGISSAGAQFGMVMGGTAYFVVNDETRARYERMGSTCFSYTKGRGRVAVKRYYSVPADVLEDTERLTALARESIQIALATRHETRRRPTRATAAKRPPRRKSQAKSR